jgi:hypothetical protein
VAQACWLTESRRSTDERSRIEEIIATPAAFRGMSGVGVRGRSRRQLDPLVDGPEKHLWHEVVVDASDEERSPLFDGLQVLTTVRSGKARTRSAPRRGS